MTRSPTCRACGTGLAQTFVDLGSTPLANSYLRVEDLAKPEATYPLHARVCPQCRLVQVEAAASPHEIFSHYSYFSSYSAQWVEHARQFAVMATTRWNLGPGTRVVEVASNDGYLLQHFLNRGTHVLGIDPAANVAAVAQKIGVKTEVAFFGRETARRLAERGEAADLIIANNVLAHVPDINDFVAGLAIMLKPDGVVSLEFPHLLQLVRNIQFDTIYHEHFSYLSLFATEALLNRHQLRVFDLTELPTHGGSLRVMACKSSSTAHSGRQALAKVRADEVAAHFDTDAGYAGFSPKVRDVQTAFVEFLRTAKRDGKSVAAYGAAAKGNTLLNTCGIDTELIQYVVDLNPHKQGLYLPGSHLPIHPPSRLLETRPNYIVILPWNLKDEIVGQMSAVGDWGGRFVVAVPKLFIFAPNR